MSPRPALHDVPCAPGGGGCNDLTATTQRHELGAGVTVLHWPCGHAHVHIATSTDVKVHAPDKSHKRRFWHPADTRDAITDALTWIGEQGLTIGLTDD